MITALRQSRVWGPPTPCLLRCNRRLSTPPLPEEGGGDRETDGQVAEHRSRWPGTQPACQVGNRPPSLHSVLLVDPEMLLSQPRISACQPGSQQTDAKAVPGKGLEKAQTTPLDSHLLGSEIPVSVLYYLRPTPDIIENNREGRAGPSLAGSSSWDGWWEMDKDDETAPATSVPCVSLLWAQSQHNLRGVAFPPCPLDLSEYWGHLIHKGSHASWALGREWVISASMQATLPGPVKSRGLWWRSCWPRAGWGRELCGFPFVSSCLERDPPAL